jgi:threonine dehydrogenase-like Zn-dependent dehydrogenase
MKAISLKPRTKDSMSIIDMPEPQINGRDVLVKVVRVGVCGTDQELKDGVYGEAPAGSDHLVIGHEGLGRVAQVGSPVEGIAVGDYVVASVRRPCPHDWCLPCRSGQNDMCITGDYTERGIKGQHGYLSEYYSEQPARLTVVPAGILQAGVFLEPLSIVEKAIRQTNKIQERLPWNNQKAVVLGAGTIGLLGAMLLRLEGINTYVLDHSDREGFKSGLITQIGAHHVDTRETSMADVADTVGRVDLVLEATGYAPLVLEAFQLLAMDGVMCLLGVSGGAHEISMDATEFNNSLVLGNRLMFGAVNANVVDFQSGVGHIQDIIQRWPGALESMITRRVGFAEYDRAFDRGPDDIKAVVEMGP